MPAIDLNADMGEYANDKQREIEAALMPLITSCSIACGGHAGDAETMGVTVRLAKAHGVKVGAHPSYPDRAGFGRRSREYDASTLLASLAAQIRQLRAELAPYDLKLAHIKPHGALYNDAAKNTGLANIVASVSADTVLVGPPDSELEKAAKRTGIKFVREGFVDRLYLADGSLTPRGEPGAVIADVDARAQQALRIASGFPLRAATGEVKISAETLCIHSDSPSAVETATSVRKALRGAGIEIRSFA